MSEAQAAQGTPAPAAPAAISPEVAAAQVAASLQAPVPVAAPAAVPVPAAPAVPPAVAPAPVAQVPAAPAAAQPASAPVDPLPPNPGVDTRWLNKRLERERTSLLSELGAASLDDARSRIAAGQQATTTAQQLTALTALVDAQAAQQMAALSEEQRTTINSFVPQMRALGAQGTDAQLQLAAIGHFARPAATVAAAPTVATPAAPVAPAQPVAPVAPATTSPAPGAPDGSAPGSPPDARSLYESARARNPFAAAEFGAANPRVYGS